MTRLMVRSLVALIVVVIISICFLTTRLLAGRQQNRRVHLNARQSGFGDLHRLYDPRGGQHQDEEWIREFVLKGKVAHPQRQFPGAVAHKLDTASDSIPDSEDDTPIDEKNVDDGAVFQAVAGGNEMDPVQKFQKKFMEVRDNPKPAGGSPACSPEKSVAMVKTHKCSSSTLQNILLRRAEDLNLTLAVPREGVYLGSPQYFDRRFILGDYGRTKYNIMASHMRFRRPRDVQEVMASDAKYITILRNPAQQYESMFTYYGWRGQYHAEMEDFLANPDRYFRIFEPEQTRVAGRNPMCFDNGLDARRLPSGDSKVEAFIGILSRWYDLVLIAEYFEESLILFKELMCWTLDDVVFFSQNARNKESVVPLSLDDQDSIRRWNWADTLLYEHFNATLWARIEKFGRERMAREVTKLRLKNEALAKDCIGEVVKEGDKRVWYPEGIKVNSFLLNENAVNRRLCEQLTRPELTYLKFFREKKLGQLYGPDFRSGDSRIRVIPARDPRNRIRRHWAKLPS